MLVKYQYLNLQLSTRNISKQPSHKMTSLAYLCTSAWVRIEGLLYWHLRGDRLQRPTKLRERSLRLRMKQLCVIILTIYDLYNMLRHWEIPLKHNLKIFCTFAQQISDIPNSTAIARDLNMITIHRTLEKPEHYTTTQVQHTALWLIVLTK